MYLFWLVAPLPTWIGPFPAPAATEGEGGRSSLGLPTWPRRLASPGEGGPGAGGTGQQHEGRGGAGTEQGRDRAGQAAAPIPRCSRAPALALPSWGRGLEAGARLPGRSVPLRFGLAAEEGGRPHVVAGRARDPPCEQDPGSLTAPSPSAPFPGPSPPGASPRPPPARPGPDLSPPRSPRLRPPPTPGWGARTAASPSAAAEAAVGPIVVGIEVRHLPSPLREEPG